MYDVGKVNTALTGLVGWNQPINPEFAIVDAENQSSSSSRFFTDNQLVKISSLINSQDYIDVSDADFNEFLRDIYRKSVVNVIDKVFDQPDFIDRQLLYKRPNNKVDVDPLPDGFVGYEIVPSLINNYAFEITRVILEFENVGTDVELVLYNSAKKQPILSQIVTVTDNPQEVVLNWKLDGTGDIYRGKYYFGYRTDGVTLQPVRREYESADIISCIDGLYVHPVFSVQPTTELFDLEDVDNVEESWGLNLDFTCYRDFTDLIVQNKRLFAPAIQMQGQVICLEEYLASSRSNRDERIAHDNVKNIMIELDGINTESFKKKGLKYYLSTEITKAKKEITKLLNGYSDQNYITSITRC